MRSLERCQLLVIGYALRKHAGSAVGVVLWRLCMQLQMAGLIVLAGCISIFACCAPGPGPRHEPLANQQ